MRRSLLLAALVLAPASVHAQAPQPTPPVESTVHRHLGGFWRLDGGIGYVASSASLAGTTRSMSGVAIPFGFAFGVAVTREPHHRRGSLGHRRGDPEVHLRRTVGHGLQLELRPRGIRAQPDVLLHAPQRVPVGDPVAGGAHPDRRRDLLQSPNRVRGEGRPRQGMVGRRPLGYRDRSPAWRSRRRTTDRGG
jgi:hypothetical protein